MATPHPRAHLNTGGKPPARPDSQPADSVPAPAAKPPAKALEGPKQPPVAKGRIPVGTKLEPAELAALDRLVKRLSGEQPATRSFALRWLVRQHCD